MPKIRPNRTLEFWIRIPYSGEVSENRYLKPAAHGGLYISPTARYIRTLVVRLVHRVIGDTFSSLSGSFDLVINVGFPRKFSKRSGDAPNFDKFLRDSVALALGLDDAGTVTGTQAVEYGLGDQAYIELHCTVHGVSRNAIGVKHQDDFAILDCTGFYSTPWCYVDNFDKRRFYALFGIPLRRRKTRFAPERSGFLRYGKKRP